MSVLTLPYIDKVPVALQREFSIKVAAVAKLLGGKLADNPQWLMQVFKSESGVNPAARNTAFPFYKDGKLDGYATGLIQFIPSTARGLGTTTEALEKMGYLRQLDYVYLYLKKFTGELNSYADLYLVIFFPAAVGQGNNDSYVFETKHISRSAVARSNPGIDLNKDGKITMGEFKGYLRKTVPQKYWPVIFGSANGSYTVPSKGESDSTAMALLLLLGFAAVINK